MIYFFSTFDTNNDTVLSRSEFIAFAQYYGDPLSSEEIDFMFTLLDENRNEVLSWNETYEFASTHGSMPLSLYSKTEQVNLYFG